MALVTGGGSGAGAAIARRCAAMGANVVVADIDFALAGEVAGKHPAAPAAARWRIAVMWRRKNRWRR